MKIPRVEYSKQTIKRTEGVGTLTRLTITAILILPAGILMATLNPIPKDNRGTGLRADAGQPRLHAAITHFKKAIEPAPNDYPPRRNFRQSFGKPW